jgi:hypothetical protein
MNDKTKIIGICYIVFGALGLLGLPMIYVHQLLMNSILSNVAEVDPEAREVLLLFNELMEILIPLLVVLVVAHIVFNVLVGICFIRNKAYYTCLISSILTCLFFPVGTLLGVFALLVLTDEKIKPLFHKKRPLPGQTV